MNKIKIYFTLILATFILTGASCISFNKNTSIGYKGIYLSEDKGETWKPAMAFPTIEGVKNIAGVNVYRIFDDPSDVNAYYLGSRGQGLYYTYNNGESWASVPFMNGKFVYALAVDPKNKCVIYASDGPRVYKTDDCTRTWKQSFLEQRTNERVSSLAIDKNTGAIWGTLIGGDLIVSRDKGKSWTVAKRFDYQLQEVVLDEQTPGRIYVALVNQGLFRSDDDGKNWTNLRDPLKDFSDALTFYRIQLNPMQKDSLFWVSKYGILRSDDAGNSWRDLQLLTRPGSVIIYGFTVNPKNDNEIYYTGTILGEKNAHIRSTFYKSNDGGETWTTKQLPTDTIPFVMRLHNEKDNMLFIGFTLLN